MSSDYSIFQPFEHDKEFFYPAGADFPSMMRKQVTKHENKLQPIYEAVTNAFEAIDNNGGEIAIKLYFTPRLTGNGRDLNSVIISDTGHGVEQADLMRIETLFDTSKGFNNFGSGRIQYLHFVENTDIHSVYKENGKKYMRRFIYSINFYKNYKSVLWEGIPEKVDGNIPTGTTVALFTFKNDDDRKFYNELTTEKLRKELFDRYLGRMCLNSPNNPTVNIVEYVNDIHNAKEDKHITNDDLPSIDKNFSFTVNYRKLNEKGKLLEINKKESFLVNSYKLPIKIQNKNEVKIMSKGEVVPANGLNFSFIEHSPKIDDCFRLFLISGNYFSNKDTDKRGNLILLNEEQLKKQRSFESNFPEDLVIEDIQEKATTNIAKHYTKIKDAHKNVEEKIERLVDLYSLDEKKVRKIASNPNATTLEVFKEIYISDAEDKANKYNKLDDIMNSMVELNPVDKDYEGQLDKKIKGTAALVPEINRLELLNYVSKRKVVLRIFDDILKKKLIVQQQGKEKKGSEDKSETLIHKILFPKKSTDVLSSNLWLINEDYIHYQGISDTKFSLMEYKGESLFREDLTEEERKRLNSFNQKRLTRRSDILLFPTERKCIIIELKGISVPASKYINQVFDYAGLLREFAKDKFMIDDFYCFLIGEEFSYEDVKRAHTQFNYDYTKTYMFLEDERGVYGGSRDDARIRFVVCRYSDLLKRAQLRNKIFTDKISTKHNGTGNVNSECSI